ncbi:MAG: type I-E CRISPR-associated protein Cse1/CasA [Hyphomicrobiales bacterium]|nr:type I-E CRISPR-associated protein Cse1/CasA [Hyphomicrobiales bacterium]
MSELYSLAVEPWLPVAMADGSRRFIAIRDIAHVDVLRIDTGRADCDISLTEFLIGLLAIALAPEEERDWVKRFHAPPTPDEIDAAIRPFAHALVLDGPGPRFLQDFEVLQGKDVRVSSLLMDQPGANTLKDNTDHFVKRGQTGTLSRAGAAIALLTLQTSAPSGGAGHRTSMRGGGPVTTLVIPRLDPNKPPTLWQILWANTPCGYRVDPADAAKAMPWLAPTRTSNKNEVTTPGEEGAAHPAQAFFGMPRRIRLNFLQNEKRLACDLLGGTDDVVVHNYVTCNYGVNYKAWLHPLSPHYKQKKKKSAETLPLHFKSSKVNYEQWVGLTLNSGDGLRLPAKIVFDFAKDRAGNLGIKPSEMGQRIGLLACGYAMNKMKPLDFTEAMLPLISTGDEARDADLGTCAYRMVAAAELAASQLLTALKIALFFSDKIDNSKTVLDAPCALFFSDKIDNSKTVLDAPCARFWAETESGFYDLLRKSAAGENTPEAAYAVLDSTCAAWLPIIRNAAMRIFDETAPIDAPEDPDIKDIVQARKLLHSSLPGYGRKGKKLFNGLGMTPPESKKPKGKAA